MLNLITEINWLGVVVATLASFILGALWFTLLFGKAYAIVLGRADKPQEKPELIFILGPLICTIFTTITSAILLAALQITTIADAFTFGLIIGLGYFVTTMTNTAINPNMPHPLKYALISGSYFTLGSIMTCLILVAMA